MDYPHKDVNKNVRVRDGKEDRKAFIHFCKGSI